MFLASRKEVIKIATEIAQAVVEESKKNPDIGEVYAYMEEGDNDYRYFFAPTNLRCKEGSKLRFYPFKQKDVTDYVDNKVKIFGTWFERKHLFYYYTELYGEVRERILQNV